MVSSVVVMALWSMLMTREGWTWDHLRSSDVMSLRPWVDFSHKAPRTCAPWLRNKADRRVAFVSLATMKNYYQPSGYKGGEFYMSASLDYALRQNGFSVDTFSARKLMLNSPDENEKLLSKYHRVFTNGVDIPQELGFPKVPWNNRCKYRTFTWWGGRMRHNNSAWYNHRQLLLAYPGPDFQNTFLGFFPHSLLWNKNPTAAKQRKVALLLGKNSNLIRPLIPVLPILLQNGFEIHTTCWDCEHMANVTIHKNVGPFDYIQILQSAAVLIGAPDPLDSPSPLEGLANGVAFLNPILNSHDGTHPAQHAPLMMLGSPYVYNVHLDNYTQVLAAAISAVDMRFASFVPPDYRVEALEARVCSILEDDALCGCSNPTDCLGSSVVRNTPNA